MTKKLYIKTYGCQMNVYDSVRMTDVLAPLNRAEGNGRSMGGANPPYVNPGAKAYSRRSRAACGPVPRWTRSGAVRRVCR